jgi:hypothetical protein
MSVLLYSESEPRLPKRSFKATLNAFEANAPSFPSQDLTYRPSRP